MNGKDQNWCMVVFGASAPVLVGAQLCPRLGCMLIFITASVCGMGQGFPARELASLEVNLCDCNTPVCITANTR